MNYNKLYVHSYKNKYVDGLNEAKNTGDAFFPFSFSFYSINNDYYCQGEEH